jgi:ribosomal protein L32
MKCPNCGKEKTEIVDCRSRGDKKQRRRLCSDCGHRFNTTEMYTEDYNGKQAAAKWLLELAEKHEKEGKQWVKLSALQAIKHLLG